jgi:hypothetical protein
VSWPLRDCDVSSLTVALVIWSSCSPVWSRGGRRVASVERGSFAEFWLHAARQLDDGHHVAEVVEHGVENCARGRNIRGAVPAADALFDNAIQRDVGDAARFSLLAKIRRRRLGCLGLGVRRQQERQVYVTRSSPRCLARCSRATPGRARLCAR